MEKARLGRWQSLVSCGYAPVSHPTSVQISRSMRAWLQLELSHISFSSHAQDSDWVRSLTLDVEVYK